ncbi:hypothetical protein KQX54_012059 [Cotesia glomerata]|uniref:Uncharacterized protein n=1 Tax=Cotesia glomerata TaxID=32391 RepID=A0AAV7I7E9_COTGL|nr:hypothetical protein KQX54_012059 [Cotesia glomerata]
MWITVHFSILALSPVGSDIAVEDFSFEVLLSERETGRKLDNTIDLDSSEETIEDNPAEIMADTEEARLKRIISLMRHIPVFSGEGDVEPFIDAIEYCTPKLREGDRDTFIFELASRLSGMAVGSMRAFMKSATTIDGMFQEENESVAKFGARLESTRSQAANKIERSNLSAEQKAYRVNDLNAAALETLIVGLKQQLSYAVSNREPETLENALKIALEVEIQGEKTEAMNRAKKEKVHRKEREHAKIRQDDSRQDKDKGQASFKVQDNFNEGVMIRTVLGVTTIDDHIVIITTLVTIKLEEGIATITEDKAEATIIRTK